MKSNEKFALDANEYMCQSKCQQYRDGYVWMWKNWNNKDKDMFANCMLECMGINSSMPNQLGYTTTSSVSDEYRYTPSSP